MITTFIPFGDIPKTRFAGRKASNWLSEREREEYFKNPNPLIKETDVIYNFNSHGYRCGEFCISNSIKVLSIGCSWTLGEGLPFENTYPSLFCTALGETLNRPIENWNLAINGGSNDYIVRTLHCAIPILKPNIVIICFSSLSRREYISADGTYYSLYSQVNQLKNLSQKDNEIIKHYYGLTSHYNDQLNFFSAYKSAESLLNLHKIKWLYSTTYGGKLITREMKSLAHIFDKGKFVDDGINIIDFARDNKHPGKESMKRFSNKLIDKIFNIYPF